ncbi:uncharacterized protein LOC129607147 [Condylostylus longicornis]|uniref:uncharacterized protein LOC129607147 n=1 Tax=Condylostylus longicornis TaxID=2530218 RepID=UPI00244DDDAA|nr:uncharacterized protein LOC129607147 [Condylostylus longicornis]
MTANSKEREFRYICQWFSEFSELQREDFVPVLVDYLIKEEIYMNGVLNSLSSTGCNDKPMSLYQCRIKLFKEWTPKWPEDMKLKLKAKIAELDSKIGEKVEQELLTIGNDNGSLLNGKENGHIENHENENINPISVSPGPSQENLLENEQQPQPEQIPAEEINEPTIENREDALEQNLIE